jgi:hypothetical protein
VLSTRLSKGVPQKKRSALSLQGYTESRAQAVVDAAVVVVVAASSSRPSSSKSSSQVVIAAVRHCYKVVVVVADVAVILVVHCCGYGSGRNGRALRPCALCYDNLINYSKSCIWRTLDRCVYGVPLYVLAAHS